MSEVGKCEDCELRGRASRFTKVCQECDEDDGLAWRRDLAHALNLMPMYEYFSVECDKINMTKLSFDPKSKFEICDDMAEMMIQDRIAALRDGIEKAQATLKSYREMKYKKAQRAFLEMVNRPKKPLVDIVKPEE
ncbi:MAG: hypothetical protein QG591_2670 [Planctomycetota bacterium]|nr:hypothetical protein [Planctomycetota bacterium]